MGAARRRPACSPLPAFTLIEVLFALFIFLVMVLMFASVTVATARSSRFGNSYAQAASLAQHKIDQIETEGFDTIVSNPTKLAADGVTDGPGMSTGNLPNKNSSLTVAFTDVDHLSSFFYAAKDAAGMALPDSASGTIVFTPYPAGQSSAARMLQATITISWRDQSHARSTYTTQALITLNASL